LQQPLDNPAGVLVSVYSPSILVYTSLKYKVYYIKSDNLIYSKETLDGGINWSALHYEYGVPDNIALNIGNSPATTVDIIWRNNPVNPRTVFHAITQDDYINFNETFTAEDVENTVNQRPVTTEDILSSLVGSAHTPGSIEEIVAALSGSRHIPGSLEDTIVTLAKKSRSSEDLLYALTEVLHIANLSEDVIVDLLAKRTYPTQDVIYERPLLFRGRMAAFPIFGGSHVIQVKGEEE
jgi:hypothetical protein